MPQHGSFTQLNNLTRVDEMELVAGLSGKTSFEVWESGNDWSGIIANAEKVLGKQSKWHRLRDENGDVFAIIGKNGSLLTGSSTTVGATETYAAGQQLVTDVVKEESGALTAYTGNIVNEAGKVTKKGLTLGASRGAKVLGGVALGLGAVMTGVDWYKDNPEFWTDVSQKLLPFAYKDPTDKSWGDIFYDALSPTAVDSEGVTYVPENIAEELAGVLVANGVFNAGNESKWEYTGDIYGLNNGLLKTNPSIPYIISAGMKGHITQGSSTPDYRYITSDSSVKYVAYKDYNYDRGLYTGYSLYAISDKPFLYGEARNTWGDIIVPPEANKSPTYETINGKPLYYASTGIGLGQDTQLFDFVTEPLVTQFEAADTDVLSYWGRTVAYITLYGTDVPVGNIDNVMPYPDAIYPTAGKSLRDTYPDWYDKAVTTVNPNWKPGEPESEDNPKYVTWLPLQFPDEDIPDGDTQPDATPDDAQSGKPKPDTPVNPDTDTAYNDGILPDPYPTPDETPSLNPDPQPEPLPEPTPDPTDPSKPGNTPTPTPTPGIPNITGGSANALWKIYAPSHATLQQFGAWLWSTDPVKMIKELFSNNPADGIVGLHMIYVTPSIGGTANIVVGYVDSGVASPWVSQQYTSIDCGSVTVPLRYQSALDFGYTKVYAYLPFIGIVPLDSYDIIGKTVNIKYTVDVLTGTVLAQISVSGNGYNAVLYTYNGSCAVEYPLTSGSRASQMLSLITGAVGGGLVGGAGGALLGGSRGALTGADVRMSGNLAGNAGAMGIRKPYIIVKRPVEVPARNYNTYYGYPANITGRLSSFNGYVRVKDVHVDDISGATADEKQEIERLLKAGVIVN